MPENLGDLMREATKGVSARWDPPETIRRRGDRRKLRLRVVALLAALSALGLSGAVALGPADAPELPRPDPTTLACVPDLTLPSSEREVQLRVSHSTIEAATPVADKFRERGFNVVQVVPTEESNGDFTAVIRYGPAEVGEARLVQAWLPPGQVSMDFDPYWKGVVDLILGTRFSQLATEAQMRERMVTLGPLVPPC